MAEELSRLYKTLIKEKVQDVKANNIYFPPEQEVIKQVKERLDSLGLEFSEQAYEYLVNTVFPEYDDAISFNKIVSIPERCEVWVLPNEMDATSKETYWSVYADSLSNNLHLSESEINEVKETALNVVNRLMPPNCPYDASLADKFVKKGLVYGNVQSGKTASMGAVIAQYATKGCRAIFVLSGVHTNLQRQTLNRLRRDLGIDLPETKNLHWRLITNPSDNMGVGCQPISSLLAENGTVLFGVFKKNHKILKKLNDNFFRIKEPNKALLEKSSILIIDDECDQASPDVSKEEEEERSKTNDEIVRMLNFFPRVAYVGYTATPFANVLNEPPGKDSLYPADFITMLPEKPDYFGTSKIFSLGEEFEEYHNEQDETLNIINTYDEADENRIFRKAIIYFILATSIKILRARKLQDEKFLNQHSTMMVQISGKIQEQQDAKAKIDAILSSLIVDIKSGNKIKEQVECIWKSEILEKENYNLRAISKLFTTPLEKYILPSFEEVYIEFCSLIRKIETRIDNSNSADFERLFYSDEHPDYFIVVGGNTLSRGLTLEGLIVSLFTRTVKTYDTLLQMGRWFGYRKNYEDLVRLWMTPEALQKFQFLAGVELDLRETIDKYKDATPRTLALPIRTNPHMQIVRKLAMKSAVDSSINYSGRHPQTIYFKNDKKWLEDNMVAVKALISKNSSIKGKICNSDILLENISRQSIEEFISEYHFYPNSNGLEPNLLLKYKNRVEEEGLLDSWNVVVKTLSGGKHIVNDLVPGFDIALLERRKIKDSDSSRINLKAITSPSDILADIPAFGCPDPSKLTYSEKFKVRGNYFEKMNRKVPGLLIIYPIYQKSGEDKPEKGTNRILLNAKADVYGVCIVFPFVKIGEYDSVCIKLPNVLEVEKEDYAEE